LVVLLIKIPIKLNVNWQTIPKVTLPGATLYAMWKHKVLKIGIHSS